MRLLQLAIAIDQVLNTLAGGWADETLSARAWRCRATRRRWRIAYRVINAVFSGSRTTAAPVTNPSICASNSRRNTGSHKWNIST